MHKKIYFKNFFPKKLFFLLLLPFFCFPNKSFAQNLSTLNSHFGCGENYSALVFNLKNNDIIFEKDSDKIIYPASLTKLMTLYLVFENLKDKKLRLNDKLLASNRAVEVSKINKINTLNLSPDDKISVELAIKGLIVKSFNELSVMLAEKIAGDEWQFVRYMNLKSKELGMFFTNFRNSNGFHNFGQITTDEDLAILVLAIRRDFPEYYHYFSLKSFRYNNQKYTTHNNILLNYKGADGMKTGFTNASGFNLVTSVKKQDKKIVSILTGCESLQKRDDLAKYLLDLALKIKK